MNNRIKQIYEFSLTHETGTDNNGNPMHVIKQNPEKFAKMIISRALTCVENSTDGTKGKEYHDALRRVEREMLDYFGVEND